MASLTTPWFAANLTETLVTGQDTNKSGLIIAWFCILTFQAISTYRGTVGAATIGQDIARNIRTDLHGALLSVNYSYFFKEKKGMAISLFSHESGLVSHYLSTQIISLIPQFLTVAGASVLLLRLNFTMGMFILTFIPLTYLLVKYLSRNLKHTTQKLLEKHEHMISQVEQDIQLTSEIKTHNLQFSREEYFRTKNSSLANTGKSFLKTSSIISPAVQIFGYISLAIYLLFLGSGLLSTTFSISEIVQIILYSLIFLRPISGISSAIGSTQNVLSALERIRSFLSDTNSENYQHRLIGHCDFKNDVIFDNVTFRYKNNIPPVLHNFSLTIKGGETVVVSGKNGSGKSTLAALILQLVCHTSGTIRIGTSDISMLDLNYLRHHISYVGQKEQLFDTTIRENLIHHGVDHKDSEIIKILKVLNLWEWIRELPNRLDQQVGEQGVLLSGGQAQKIALARVLLQKRDIIILDEATSMLDKASEENFFQHLNADSQEKTIVIITHNTDDLRLPYRSITIGNNP